MLKDITRKNSIIYIQTPRGRIDGVMEVKEAVKIHFESRFH